MKSEKQESTAHRLSFTGPLLLFVLLFVICCGVLACVFVRADATSREAEIYNASVSLSAVRRNGFVPGKCRKMRKCFILTGSFSLVKKQKVFIM